MRVNMAIPSTRYPTLKKKSNKWSSWENPNKSSNPKITSARKKEKAQTEMSNQARYSLFNEISLSLK